MAVTRQQLSGSSGGRPIAIATAVTTLHTSITGSTSFDEAFVYVTNLATASKKVTVYLGSTAATKDKMFGSVPAQDAAYLMVPGNSFNLGKAVKALATGGGANLTAFGWVNRIVP